MKTDLFYLALTAMLTASLWFPYVVSQFRTNGPLRSRNYVDPLLPKASLFGDPLRIAAVPRDFRKAGLFDGGRIVEWREGRPAHDVSSIMGLTGGWDRRLFDVH